MKTLSFSPQDNLNARVSALDMETYFSFNASHPRPVSEEVHLKHIFRLYVARALSKTGHEDIYVLPSVAVETQPLLADILAVKDGRALVAFCDKESVTPQTEQQMELLRGMENVTVLLLHSQFGEAGGVPQKFADEIAAKKVRIMAVVPPPFDDAYEYDVWIFETTFRDVFEEGLS